MCIERFKHHRASRPQAAESTCGEEGMRECGMRNEHSGTALYRAATAACPKRSSALAPPNTGETGPMIHVDTIFWATWKREA